MFLTGMAANPLMADFARKIGHVDLTWARWAIGSSVPGLLALIVLPWAIFHLHPPKMESTDSARAMAGEELRKRGPLSRGERWLVAILLLVMAGWVTSPWHGFSNTIVALSGISALLVTGVISWDDLLAERRAWEALIWFGGLIMMADELLRAGVVNVLSQRAFGFVQGWSAAAALIALLLIYMYVHYGFASMTAQVTALYPGFLAAILVSGVNPLVGALSLAYFSNLNACMTHYGTGSAPVYFGTGYVTQKTVWKIGFIASLLNVAIWLGVGLAWWKVLGWW
jgi:DASS family divalent anion:Na+ symporter